VLKTAKIQICTQEGSTIVITLFVFLIVSILGSALLNTAILNTKIALYDSRCEKARQAADAGIYVARDIIMNCLGAGKTLPDTIPEINLGNDAAADVAIDDSDFYTRGVVTITSTGKITDANGNMTSKKTAVAEIKINTVPYSAIKAHSFRVAGKYFAEVSPHPAQFESTLPEEITGHFSIQDWDAQAYDSIFPQDTFSEYPLKGRTYRDYELQLPHHPDWEPANSNNTVNDLTWWVEYKYHRDSYGNIQGHNLNGSTLYVAPYWKPQGIVNITDPGGQPALIAINSWNNSIAGLSDIFYYKITDPESPALTLTKQRGNCNVTYPPENLDSRDFMGSYEETEQVIPSSVEPNMLAKCRKLAQLSDGWQYIAADSELLQYSGNNRYKLFIDDPKIEKSQWFIDLPENTALVLDFTVAASYTGSWIDWDSFDNMVNDTLVSPGSFFNRFWNRLENIIAVSPATIEIGCDSLLFDKVNPSTAGKPSIFLISGQDINLHVDPSVFNTLSRILPNTGSERQMRIYILAGNNAKITSTPQIMNFQGLISAGNNIDILIDYFAETEHSLLPIREIEKEINICQDFNIIDEFPESWAYIGLAPIVSFYYAD